MSNTCAICKQPATKQCGGCKQYFYCSRDHQKAHWDLVHKNECTFLEMRENAVLGRYCVAKRFIKKGQVILEEKPVVVGPKAANHVMCLGCSKTLTLTPNQTNYYKCSKCTWPMCGRQCESSPNHIPECELMSSKKYKCSINYNDNNRKESSYCIIVPLRIMLLKRDNPKLYEKVMSLQSHLDVRESTPFYNIMRANLVPFLSGFLGLKDFDANTIMSIAGILDTNTFEIRLPNQNVNKIRALFVDTCMLSHDCTPNTKHIFKDDMSLNLIATDDIKKGTILSVSYTQPLKNTLTRRLHLKSVKCFDCACNRCSDPTELGTYAGAIMCLKCKNEKLLSMNPLDNNAAWSCKSCRAQISGQQYHEYNGLLSNEIMSIDKRSPADFEKFLQKYEKILHPTNSYIIEVKYALTQLYGSGVGGGAVTDDLLQRRMVLCRDLLQLADVVEPGLSRFRGILLLDCHEILMTQTQRRLQSNGISKEDAQIQMQNALIDLNEATEILKVESDLKHILPVKRKILLEIINSI